MIFFTDKTMTVINNGKTDFVDLDTDLGKQCLDFYRTGDESAIVELIEASKLLGNGVEESENGKLLVDGVEMDIELANKVREFKQKGIPFDYLVKLAQKINAIPSFHVREQLYGFLAHNGHPITKDGNFIAYKKVREDYRDIHSGDFDNSVGQTVEMDRRLVDDNPNNTCSSGLHIASFDYAKNFGSGRLMLCEVDPLDVVSVPIDYDNMKMRACKYKVVGETKESIDKIRFGGDNPLDAELGDYITFPDQPDTVYEIISVSTGTEDIYVNLLNIDDESYVNGVVLTMEEFYFA